MESEYYPNSIYTPRKKNPDNCRGLTFGNCLGKCFTRILKQIYLRLKLDFEKTRERLITFSYYSV